MDLFIYFIEVVVWSGWYCRLVEIKNTQGKNLNFENRSLNTKHIWTLFSKGSSSLVMFWFKCHRLDIPCAFLWQSNLPWTFFFLNSPITWATPTNYLTKLLIEKSSHQSMKSHLNRVLLWTCFHTSLSFIKARFPFGCFITFQLWRWNVGNQIPVIQSPRSWIPNM